MAKDKTSKDNGSPASETPAAADATVSGAGSAGAKRSVPAEVAPRIRRYLIAPRRLPGQFRPMSADSLHTTLQNMGLPVIRRLKPRGFGLMSAAQGGGGEILVSEMSVERGDSLRATAPPDIIVEHDQPLVHHGQPFSVMRAIPDFMPAAASTAVTTSVRISVTSQDGKPVAGATVSIYGQGFPSHGETDERGALELSVGGSLNAVQAIYVKPRADFWERVTIRPHLEPGQPNVITLQRFAEAFPDFPQKKMSGWGQKAMGLDQLDGRFDGSGVKIGIMDSGCDNSHPQLRHVVNGADIVAGDGGSGWADDTMSHGTHCAGIIGARSETQGGICGFAPAAEIHALKVFPSGRISDLIEALDIAIDRQLDVMNMSLGSDEPSELVQQKVEAAVSAGVACIVAAGNSSGPVQFPGLLPQSITISAVGQTGQYPADSYHAMTVGEAAVGTNGFFPAKFSCFGPQVRLSGPGVAIISTVPNQGYAAWDGTSMATPHISGLAALVLAHHPTFQQQKSRDANRVATLFRILQASARPVVADPLRGGFGLPFAPAALASAPTATTPTAPTPAPPGGSLVAETTAPTTAAPPQPAPQGLQITPELLAQLRVSAALGNPLALRILMTGQI